MHLSSLLTAVLASLTLATAIDNYTITSESNNVIHMRETGAGATIVCGAFFVVVPEFAREASGPYKYTLGINSPGGEMSGVNALKVDGQSGGGAVAFTVLRDFIPKEVNSIGLYTLYNDTLLEGLGAYSYLHVCP